MPESVIKHHIWPLKVMFSNRKMPEAPDFDENWISIFLTCRSKVISLCVVTEYQCDLFQAVGSQTLRIHLSDFVTPWDTVHFFSIHSTFGVIWKFAAAFERAWFQNSECALHFVLPRAPVCEEIINCRGDQVRLALRVRVFPYPESACATWVMFACKYKSVL